MARDCFLSEFLTAAGFTTTSGAGSGDGGAGPDPRVWTGMRCLSEQLCAVSATERGADMQFAPEGFAPRWSLPSPFHGEEAKLPKGYRYLQNY